MNGHVTQLVRTVESKRRCSEWFAPLRDPAISPSPP